MVYILRLTEGMTSRQRFLPSYINWYLHVCPHRSPEPELHLECNQRAGASFGLRPITPPPRPSHPFS